jgi:hypothetical protein
MCSNGEVRRATSRHTAQPPAPITTVADSRYTLVPLTHSAYTDSLLALNRTHPHPLTSIETPPTHSHAHTLPPSPTPTISTLQDPTSRERDAIVAEFYGALNTAASPSDLNDLQKEWANTAASLNLSDELLSEIQGVCTAWWCSLVLPSPIRAFRVASVCMLELEDTAPFALTPSLSLPRVIRSIRTDLSGVSGASVRALGGRWVEPIIASFLVSKRAARPERVAGPSRQRVGAGPRTPFPTRVRANVRTALSTGPAKRRGAWTAARSCPCPRPRRPRWASVSPNR